LQEQRSLILWGTVGNVTATPNLIGTTRDRIRVELVNQIKDTARRHLAESGATGLSLRAVTRDIGMVSSSVYRYFPSRDDLLTALIIDGYNSLGLAVETAEAAVKKTDYRGRWMASTHAVRTWALEHRHEYALLFGTPVPKYSAPIDTIEPASRVSRVLLRILAEMVAAGQTMPAPLPVPKAVRPDMLAVRQFAMLDPHIDRAAANSLTDDLLVRGLMAWTGLFGAVSFELFGHRQGSVENHSAFFAMEMERLGAQIGT
jgi:AcrR family transcriptional regulator